MSDPFLIEGPAVISFSGGRTSGYMLRRILDAHGGTLPADVHVLFADTGKERAETLEFIDAVAQAWGVPIVWVERPGQFTQLITDKKALPSPPRRWCTSELKIKPMRAWMLAHGYQVWTNIVGIRADEPRRIAKIRQQEQERSERLVDAKWINQEWDIRLPLADAGVCESDVLAFWRSNAFDLRLKANEGNCDLCFLKKLAYKRNIVRDHPQLAQWWAEQEDRIGHSFRFDHPTYRSLLAQPDLFTDTADENLIECFCTD